MADGSQKHLSTNALDNASTGQAKAIGLASVLTMDWDATFKKKKPHTKGNGKKRPRLAAVGRLLCMPVKVPLSKDVHL